MNMGRTRAYLIRGCCMPTSAKETGLTLRNAARLAARYDVPLADALLIAVNLYGISSDQHRHRARVTLCLADEADIPWMAIIPLNAAGSPFRLQGTSLYLEGDLIAQVNRIDADEAVGGYFRDDGRAATLNPNARDLSAAARHIKRT